MCVTAEHVSYCATKTGKVGVYRLEAHTDVEGCTLHGLYIRRWCVW